MRVRPPPELADLPPAEQDLLWRKARRRVASRWWWVLQVPIIVVGFTLSRHVSEAYLGRFFPNPRFVDILGMIAFSALYLPSATYLRRRLTARELWRVRTDLCPTCGYRLTGNTSAICPECGSQVPPAAQTQLHPPDGPALSVPTEPSNHESAGN